MLFRKNILYIYTDGSSLPNPRKGGIGIRYVYLDENENEIKIDLDIFGYKEATNNQMELKAVIEGLNQLPVGKITMPFSRIEIRTDSRYVSENKNNAIYKWSKSKWLNSYGKPIENAELWKDLIKALKSVTTGVDFRWIKGHSKDPDNKAVDKIAKKSARSALNKPLTVTKLRKKKFPEKTKVGSVKMLGQRLLVYIINDSFLRLSKKSKYRYQVLSKVSDYYKKIDIAYSNLHHLKSGHYYAIRLNENDKNPEIVSVFKELATKLKSPKNKKG